MPNTPNIRFKGYSDDWEQRKLENLGEIVTGSTPSTSKEEYYSEDGIPWVTPTDISENIVYDTPRKLSKEGQKVGRVVPKDTILVTCIASIGKNTMLGTTGSFNQQINGLVPDFDKYNPYFLFTESALWSEKMKKQAAAGTMQIVNKTEFSELDTMVPKLEEQEKIGTYFRNLDNLITLHQRKCDETKELKKFMLQKMFPKNGEKKPEIRFEGFTDDWEQRKFSELYEKSSEKNDGSIDVERNITVATMQFKPEVTVSSEDYLKTYYTFNVGDIAFEGHHSKDFMFGRFVENDIGDGIVSHIFAVFRPIVDYDLYYWKYAIHNESIMRPILSKSTKASTMMHDLVTKDFLNESILVPSVDEQKRIGAYLNNLDSLITLHQRKCDEIKEINKFMLQNMFPQKG